MKHIPARQTRNPGFSLMEVLITIAIIIVLGALSMIGVQRMRFSAAQASAINQMRQIGTAAISWGAEKNNAEPFYVANGTGDYCDESNSGPTPALSPGNPAKLLYNTESPDQGYVTDHQLFFSGLVKITAPQRKFYKPGEAAPGKPWGSYVWYYPFTRTKSPKQSSASGQNLGSVRVSPQLENRLVMMTDYSRAKPVWEKVYLALLVDGTVRVLTNGEEPTRPD